MKSFVENQTKGFCYGTYVTHLLNDRFNFFLISFCYNNYVNSNLMNFIYSHSYLFNCHMLSPGCACSSKSNGFMTNHQHIISRTSETIDLEDHLCSTHGNYNNIIKWANTYLYRNLFENKKVMSMLDKLVDWTMWNNTGGYGPAT